jgi:hypothetical protein
MKSNLAVETLIVLMAVNNALQLMVDLSQIKGHVLMMQEDAQLFTHKLFP